MSRYEFFESVSPIDNSCLGRFAAAGPGDVARAVHRARQAQPGWAQAGLNNRRHHLLDLRRALTAQSDALCRLVTREIGKPLLESWATDLLPSLDGLLVLARRGPAWLKPRRTSRTLWDLLRGVRRLNTLYNPLGVVGIIGTWNYPLSINILQIAFAHLAGNAVVFKPSERAPAVARLLEDIYRNAGYPPGIFEVLFGRGPTGEALCGSGVDKMVFTGSHAAGRRVQAVAAGAGTPSIIEASGQDTALVLSDVDPARVARALCWGVCVNAGQTCVGVRRIVVHTDVYDRLVTALVKEMDARVVGDPFDPAVEVGPLRSEDVAARLEFLLNDALARGARVLRGGRRLFPGGLHFAPTLLAEVPPDALIAREEYFGPLAWVERARDEGDMRDRARRSPFGLAASVWTRDTARARSWADHMPTGTVWINDLIVSAGDARAPFGGVKASGHGRVHGPEGLREMTAVKYVETLSPRGWRPHYFPYGAQKLAQVQSFTRWKHPAPKAADGDRQ